MTPCWQELSDLKRKSRTPNAHDVTFYTASELECYTRLQDLVDLFTKNMPFAAEFEDNYWPLQRRSRLTSAGDGGLWFSSVPATKGGAGVVPFVEPFLSFMKVMICLHDESKDGKIAASGLQTMIAAGRYLYPQLEGLKFRPSAITIDHMTDAAVSAANLSGSGSKNIGAALAAISRYACSRRLVIAPFTWANPNKSPGKNNRIDPIADKNRREKLLAPEALDALADISARASDLLHPRDLIRQRGIDLLVCCGFRIGELLALPFEPIVEQAILDDHGEPMLDRFGNPATRMMLRYWPEKRGHEVTRLKPVPSVMKEVVRRAVADIQAISAPFREIARFQARHPGRTCLPASGDILNRMEVALLVGYRPKPGNERNSLFVAGGQYVINKKIPELPGHLVRRSDIERSLYDRSDKGDILLSAAGTQQIEDSLFLISMRLMHVEHDLGINGTVKLLTDEQIRVYIAGEKKQLSIFERLDCRFPDGTAIRATTHQFRHWLNTLADEGGLDSISQARFMGRQNLRQNETYRHTTPTERARQVRERTADRGRALGPVAEIAATINDPVRRDEFIAAAVPTAHTTDMGMCVHDWDADDCPRHGSCEGCNKLWITKGDLRERTNIIRELDEVGEFLRAAEEAVTEDIPNSPRWLKSQERRKRQLLRMLKVHDDPSIEDGTLVQIDHTEGDQAIEG